MKIYKQGADRITLNGQTFFADENGVIDVSDTMHNSAWAGKGFVLATGRLAELAAAKAAAEPEPVAKAVPVAIEAKADTGKAGKV